MKDFEEMNLKELAAQAQQTRYQYDQLKKQSGQLWRELETLQRKWMPDKMEELGIESVRLDGIGTISLRYDAHCTTPAKNKHLLMEWLEAHGHADLINETVNGSTLKAFMKEQMLEGNPIPDDIVKFEPYTLAVVPLLKD